MQNSIEVQKKLTAQLNEYRNSYYNKNDSIISDEEYDRLFDKLQQLEKENGTVFSNSPTQTVGYEVKSKLQKIKHNHPMLSLDKTKNVADLITFFGDKIGLLMHKLDGLTISIRYINGELVSAETRGNGEIGEDVFHNAKVFSNIPLHIDCKDEVIVDGEAIIDYQTFHRINKSLPEDKKYKNPRNLVSGSVRQLDSKIAAQRNIKFIAWKLIKGYDSNSFINRLEWLEKLGFDIVDFAVQTPININSVNEMISELKYSAEIDGIPIDGLVASYDDVAYGESLGATGHHVRSQLAFKFYDETAETRLIKVDWTMGKHGSLTPVAVFEPVEIDGSVVERASAHNVSIFKNLRLLPNDIIEVYKANQIIPQVKRNVTYEYSIDIWTNEEDTENKRNVFFSIPKSCPYCGKPTSIIKENETEVLYCNNSNCEGRLLGRLTHFVSKNAMNIEGLSEATLLFLINNHWVSNYKDIYTIGNKKDIIKQWCDSDGFGDKSVKKILDSIERSRNTTLDRFIYSLSIPMIGRTASKVISKQYNGDFDDFWFGVSAYSGAIMNIEGVGLAMANSFRRFIKANTGMILNLVSELNIEKPNTETKNNLSGLIFVITGSVNKFKNRDEVKIAIENAGGKVSGSVSKKTNYLVNNDINSTSGKNKKAKELGVKIITEDELINILNE